MKNKLMKLTLSLVMGLSFIPTADAKSADAAADTKKAKSELTQEESLRVLVGEVVSAASGISADNLKEKMKEGPLAFALKAVEDAGAMFVSYGKDGDDVKASNKKDLEGQSPKTDDGKPARSVADENMKAGKDFFMYKNAKGEGRAVVAFKLGDSLCTVGAAKKDVPAAAKKEAKAEMTQEQSMGALVGEVVSAASGISADNLKEKMKEGPLAVALKAVTDAGCVFVSYGVDGDDIKASTNGDLVGKSPKTSDDKSARSLAADKMKDVKDGKVFFTYLNADKKDRAVVAFKLGDALCTVGGPKK
jgi:hypothetical protein